MNDTSAIRIQKSSTDQSADARQVQKWCTILTAVCILRHDTHLKSLLPVKIRKDLPPLRAMFETAQLFFNRFGILASGT